MRSAWILYVVTESGRRVPHWEARTREQCRTVQRNMGRLPDGVRTVIERIGPL